MDEEQKTTLLILESLIPSADLSILEDQKELLDLALSTVLNHRRGIMAR